jgi:YaiO family outer membrane protein
MTGVIWVAIALLTLNSSISQTTADAQSVPSEQQEEPLYIEGGGFTNFVNNNYGQWSGAAGKIMYRGDKHFAPILSFAVQRRPQGSQATFGVDSYITVNKWFYAVAGVGRSAGGSAVLWPKLRYGATGMITIPGVKGLVGTVGASRIDAEEGSYARVVNVGSMYYRGKAIWTGNLAFNRNQPGSAASKSAGVAVQYGSQNKYWIGGGFAGGRIAYQTISRIPLDVRFVSFGPNLFYQKWLTNRYGFILKYDYLNQIDTYQRHGIAANIFIEIP